MNRLRTTFGGIRSLLIAVATVVAIGAMGKLHLGYDGKIAPFLVAGRIGETVRTRTFDINLQSIRLARSINAADPSNAIGPPPLGSSGVWMIAHARLEARIEPVRLMSVQLHSRDGYDYESADTRLSGLRFTRFLVNENSAEPGIPREGLLVFELPLARVVGARLRVAGTVGKARLDDVADIDLGIDEDRMATLERDIDEVYIVGEEAP